MKVTVNDRVIEVPSNALLSECLNAQEIPLEGIAVAINHVLVPRSHWHQRALKTEDNILIFQAIAGG